MTVELTKVFSRPTVQKRKIFYVSICFWPREEYCPTVGSYPPVGRLRVQAAHYLDIRYLNQHHVLSVSLVQS